MTSPRFLINHDFNEHIVRGIERVEPTIQFLRAREAGLERSPDDEVLTFAARERWIVTSHDVNTMSAAAYQRLENGLPISGLFLIPQRAAVKEIIDEIILIWSASDANDWADRVTFLPLR
jgi:hypothetical protein